MVTSKKKILRFDALLAKQGANHKVVMIRATASQIQSIANIERLGRGDSGELIGFQRQQITGHIAEIRRYLQQSDAVLPNALVIAFVGNAKIKKTTEAVAALEIDVTNGQPGLVVDGQQRLSALLQADREDFEAFVACIVCENEDELRRQFILINNTRPLSKSLIYELLPSVGALPERLSSRSLAASVIEKLNFDPQSSLHRQIKMQTNPEGFIRDTALQKLVMHSESSGALQTISYKSDDVSKPVKVVNNFFGAVQDVFFLKNGTDISQLPQG
jgi:DGQHR domain-containing protein